MNARPTIQIDTREQHPAPLSGFPVEVVGLPVGDYGVRGFSDWDRPAFIIERKSLADLIASLTRGRARFMREVEKMRAFGFAALVIEAERRQVSLGQYRSQATPQSILASLDAIAVRAGVHVYWAGSPEGCARQIEGLVRQFVRGFEKQHRALCAAAGATGVDNE